MNLVRLVPPAFVIVMIGCADVMGADFERPTSGESLEESGAHEASEAHDAVALDAANENESSSNLPSSDAGPGAEGGIADSGPTLPRDAAMADAASVDAAASDATAVDACALRTFYEDRDNDGYGNAKSTIRACFVPPGFVGISGDCDDENPIVSPGQTTARATSYVRSGTTQTSYDYDCDAREEPDRTIYPCNTSSGSWANGEVCQSGNSGVLCSYAASYRDGGGVNVTCGADYYVCAYVTSGGYKWKLVGKVACL